jgi:hypothetical protein
MDSGVYQGLEWIPEDTEGRLCVTVNHLLNIYLKEAYSFGLK